ncbi:MAG: HlyD family efflux transporter periplasmic adaptor subunit [Pseudomonadota bacterium]
MITRLKNRPRLDALDNQRRGAGKKLGRRVYLACLYGVGGFFTYFFFGSFFILDSDGLVMKDQFFIETTFPAQITKNHVEPGGFVRKGQVLLSLQSQQILDSLANVAAQRADLVAKEQNLLAMKRQAQDLIPVAETRAASAAKQLAKISRLDSRGYITNGTRVNASELAYSTQRELVRLRSEMATAQSELDTVTAARKGVDEAIERLNISYGDGLIRAPTDGIIGPKVPSEGEVFTAAETILEVLAGKPYVLAYIPTNRLYDVEEGQTVIVSDGIQKARGTVSKLGQVTDALPSEFQGAFATTERHQILKITFSHEVPFVLKAKVKISGTLGWNGVVEFASRMMFGTDKTVTATPTSTEATDAIGTLIASSDPLLPLDFDAENDDRDSYGLSLPRWVAEPAARPDVEFIEPLFR